MFLKKLFVFRCYCVVFQTQSTSLKDVLRFQRRSTSFKNALRLQRRTASSKTKCSFENALPVDQTLLGKTENLTGVPWVGLLGVQQGEPRGRIQVWNTKGLILIAAAAQKKKRKLANVQFAERSTKPRSFHTRLNGINHYFHQYRSVIVLAEPCLS